MIFDLLIALLEGLALITSPCILSILPILLSASMLEGRKRPIGVIIGFILSFDLFTLFSRQLSLSIGLDLFLIKQLSYWFLLLFGLSLFWQKLQEQIEQSGQKIANVANQLSQKLSLGKEGILGGLLTGIFLGLIWTPCAGAILGAIITQVIKQETNFASLLVLGSFSLGVAIPMLIVVLIGRRFVEKVAFIQKNHNLFRKCLGITIISGVLITGFQTIFYTPIFKFKAYYQKHFSQEKDLIFKEENRLINPLVKSYRINEFSLKQKEKPEVNFVADLLKQHKVNLVVFLSLDSKKSLEKLSILRKLKQESQSKKWDLKFILIANACDYQRGEELLKVAPQKSSLEEFRSSLFFDSENKACQAFQNKFKNILFLLERDLVIYTDSQDSQDSQEQIDQQESLRILRHNLQVLFS